MDGGKMTTPILPPYVPPFKPVPQVTPFTYRDGVTMLKKLDGIVRYINKELVPFVNENYSELAQAFQDQVNILIAQVNAALEAQTEDVDQKIADLTQFVNDAVQSIIDDSIQVQDPVVAALFTNPSQTRTAADARYALKSAFDALVTTVDGKASQSDLDALEAVVTTLDAEVADKADQSALDTTNANVAALDTRVDALDVEVDTAVAGMTMEAVKVKRGGKYNIGLYSRLRDGIVNPNLVTRVVVLGDSHANGGITTYPDQGMFQRLGYRCGVPDYRRIEDVVAGPPGGMHWWSGSIGGADTTNYYPATYPPKVAILNPNYVLHMIGSNDWARNISIPTYKGNLNDVCSSIEAANPNAINVLIHGTQRRDTIPSSGLSWDAYGNAMAEVAAMVPNRRLYINADDFMSMLGLGTNNMANILVSDNIHLGNVGNKVMANIIGAEMGIPSETDFAPDSDIRKVPFPGTTNYNANATIAEVPIGKANYPRLIEVAGTLFATASHPNSEIAIQLIKVSDGSQIDSWEQRFEETTGTSKSLSWDVYIPPATDVILRFTAIVIGGTTVNLQGAGAFTNAIAKVSAI